MKNESHKSKISTKLIIFVLLIMLAVITGTKYAKKEYTDQIIKVELLDKNLQKSYVIPSDELDFYIKTFSENPETRMEDDMHDVGYFLVVRVEYESGEIKEYDVIEKNDIFNSNRYRHAPTGKNYSLTQEEFDRIMNDFLQHGLGLYIDD